MKQHIEHLLQSALKSLRNNHQLDFDTIPSIQLDATKDKQHGDFATNIALSLARLAKTKPRDLAELIVKALPASPQLAKVEIAGPGFINFFLAPDALASFINDIISAGDLYGRCNLGEGKKVLVEFVSSNPTGPLHVGHGRHAAFGTVVSNLLAAVGYHVYREYYVNDGGRQMDILAVSVWLRYLAAEGENIVFPANGYKGNYVVDIAAELKKEYSNRFHFPAANVLQNLPLDEPQGGDKEHYIDAVIARAKELLGADNFRLVFDLSLKLILKDIHDDLLEFGVKFDNWFSERELTESDVVDRMIQTLKLNNQVYEQDGALWFRATDFHDEKDRVLQRSNGQRTYFANDLAYHISKFERGFDLAIDIFGSDHHGYIPRMKAGLQAFGLQPERLTYLLLQFVKLYRGAEQVPMSTRSGSFITLRELRAEVGNDAARFFYVMRKAEQPFDFDLELAKSESNENPVFYIQYAYARICSVFRQLDEKKLSYNQENGLKNLTLLTEPQELQLLSTLSRYCDIIINAAKQHEPHMLTNYLREVATDFHSYYNSQQFLLEEDALRNARLVLVTATRQVLANGLQLLGVSTPERM